MKKSNSMYLFRLLLVFFILNFSSCSKDSDDPIAETITVSTSDFSVTMDENPANGQVIGTVQGSTNQGSVTFSITEQTPAGAISIDASSGELKVLDGTLFNFDIHPKITGTVKVANGAVFKNAAVTITLKDGYVEKIYEGDVFLKSQQEVNDFGLQQYTHITGYLWIGEPQYLSDIEDLKPLRSLTTIGGDFHIFYNGKLRSTLGLENVSKIQGDLIFLINPVLEKVEGMQNITSIPGSLILNENLRLENLDGLNQITSVGKNVDFFDNPKLKNLDWMNNISSIGGDLTLAYTGITDIDGLSNLKSLSADVIIGGNPFLQNLNGIKDLSATINRLSITLNDSLKSIAPLRNIKAQGRVSINGNKLLASLDGLQGLEAPLSLWITDNATLQNLEGLNNLNAVIKNFTLAKNQNLKNLSGLDVLTLVESELNISHNYSLKDFCELKDLLTHGTVGSFIAEYNAYNPSKQDIIDGNCKI